MYPLQRNPPPPNAEWRIEEMKKHNYIIGIDPDVDKSGCATLNIQERKVEANCYTFPDLLDYLSFLKDDLDKKGQAFIVLVEAGYLNKSNWHTKGKSIGTHAAIGNSTGRNHEVAHIIVGMCRHWNIEVIEQRPLKKMWKGKDGKITHEELSKFVNLPKRTNQEVRDAVLLCWNHAGFPMRI